MSITQLIQLCVDALVVVKFMFAQINPQGSDKEVLGLTRVGR